MIQFHECAPFECVWLNKNKTKKKTHHKSDNEAIVLYVNTGLNV